MPGRTNDSSPTAGERAALGAFLRDFLAFGRGRVVEALVLILAVALLEGTGLLMALPVLALSGMATGSGGGLAARLLQGHAPRLSFLLAGYVLLVALHAMLSRRREIRIAALQYGYIDNLRLDLFETIGHAEWGFIQQTHTATFGHALTVELGGLGLGVHSLLDLAASGAVALAYVLVAFHLSAPLTAVAITASGVLLVSTRGQRAYATREGQKLGESSRRVHGIVAEYLAGLKLTKSANLETELAREFAQPLDQATRRILSFIARQSAARGIVRVAAAAMLATLLYLVVRVFPLPHVTVVLLLFVFLRLIPLLTQLQQAFERVLHSAPAFASFDVLRTRCRAAAEAGGEAAGFTLESGLRLDEVDYAPAPGAAKILAGVSLVLQPNVVTALVGASGAGKSTVAELVAGLLVPTAGSITIDGRLLTDRRAWRRQVAYVTQDTFFFDATIRENLRWTARAASEEQIWESLEQAAAGFVRALPLGLDTPMGERGSRLSGGERQRLSIARALLRRPLLLVLDEATSSVDRDNERAIQETLARLRGHVTVLFIAHRMAAVKSCDRVIVLERGRVIEAGSYAELASREEGYLRRAAQA